jgi:O-methyltransferase involved in polyketide biosynthesis
VPPVAASVPSTSADQLAEMSAGIHAMREDWPDSGPNLDVAELFYAGDRAEASEYLRRQGWSTERRRTSELFGVHGLSVPDTALTPFGDPVYVTASLISR